MRSSMARPPGAWWGWMYSSSRQARRGELRKPRQKARAGSAGEAPAGLVEHGEKVVARLRVDEAAFGFDPGADLFQVSEQGDGGARVARRRAAGDFDVDRRAVGQEFAATPAAGRQPAAVDLSHVVLNAVGG